jgi:twitching motility protein PilT
MQTFDQSIFQLYEQKLITKEIALRWATSPDDFKLKMQGISTTADVASDDMARNGMVRPGDRRASGAASRLGGPQITRFTQ